MLAAGVGAQARPAAILAAGAGVSGNGTWCAQADAALYPYGGIVYKAGPNVSRSTVGRGGTR